MFRKPEDAPGITTINCLLSDGGVGDIIGYLVAVNYIINTYKYINVLVWLPDYLVDFGKHVLPVGASVRSYTDAKKKYEESRIGITSSWYRHTPMRSHSVDYGFHVLADESPDITKKNYLQIRPEEINLKKYHLPEKYVVIIATSAEKVKTMATETINEIARFVKEKGYVPIFLGKTELKSGYKDLKIVAKAADLNYHLGMNLIDKTNILETTAIIAGAKAFVGMDGGPVHMAGCTETPIIVGYTFIDGKKHNVPIRKNELGWNCFVVEPDESLGCRFCQTRMNLVYKHDFRSCFYKDYKCLEHMTSNKFINYLERIL